MYSALYKSGLDDLRSLARNWSGAPGAVAKFAAVGELESMVYQNFDLAAQTVQQAASASSTGGSAPSAGNGVSGDGDNGGGS